MPHLDQREECAFGGGFGLAESIPPRIFPGPTRCETAKTPGRSSARTQSANEYHYKQNLCIFTGARQLGPGNGPSSVPARRRPRKIQGRNQRGRESSHLRSVHSLHTGFQKVNR